MRAMALYLGSLDIGTTKFTEEGEYRRSVYLFAPLFLYHETLERSQCYRFIRRHGSSQIILPNGFIDIHIDLDFVPIRIEQIQVLVHCMIAHALDRNPCLLQSFLAERSSS